MKHTAYFGLGFVLTLGLLLPAGAQDKTQSNDSLGDYARQVRKDGAPAKAKPKSFDNDNLPREDKLSIVGNATADASAAALASDSSQGQPAQGATSTGGSQPQATPGSTKTPKEEEAQRQAAYKQWQQKIEGQKSAIDLAQRELDVLQREYQLRAAAMYADVGNRMRNSADWDKKDSDYKQQIADKQKAVEDAKQKLDDIQEEARKAGVPASMRE